MIPYIYYLDENQGVRKHPLPVDGSGSPILPEKGTLIIADGRVFRVQEIVWDYTVGEIWVFSKIVNVPPPRMLEVTIERLWGEKSETVEGFYKEAASMMRKIRGDGKW